MFMGLKQWIWEVSAVAMVSSENTTLVSIVVFNVQNKILW